VKPSAKDYIRKRGEGEKSKRPGLKRSTKWTKGGRAKEEHETYERDEICEKGQGLKRSTKYAKGTKYAKRAKIYRFFRIFRLVRIFRAPLLIFLIAIDMVLFKDATFFFTNSF
jgi:hypothetical protein